MQLAQERGLLDFNKRRTKEIAEENKRIFADASRSVSKLSRRDLFMIGAALYLGEGWKRGSSVVELSNSDPKIIRLFMRFVREVLGVDESIIRGGIQLHFNVDESDARMFWSDVIGISKESFFVVRQVSSASRGKRPRNSLPYGTVRVRVNGRPLFHKLMGYIDGLTRQA